MPLLCRCFVFGGVSRLADVIACPWTSSALHRGSLLGGLWPDGGGHGVVLSSQVSVSVQLGMLPMLSFVCFPTSDRLLMKCFLWCLNYASS